MPCTQVAFTRQYDQLAAVLPNGPAERLLEVLMASLEVGVLLGLVRTGPPTVANSSTSSIFCSCYCPAMCNTASKVCDLAAPTP